MANPNKELKTDTVESKIASWSSKELHGIFPHALQSSSAPQSVHWVRESSLFGEIERFMISLHDQVVATRSHQKNIQKLPISDDKCRMCHMKSETIAHVISSCSQLANTEYLSRHNLSVGIIHQKLAEKYDLISEAELTPYYKYIPDPVSESTAIRLYWDRPIITDKTVAHNIPDVTLLVLKNKKKLFDSILHHCLYTTVPSKF